VGAEYVLGWLPKGTHQWEKFITPEELRGWLTANQAVIRDEVGVTYSPFSGTWRKSRDKAVNYMVVAEKSADAA
jgi:2-polyprenyl-6-hydroxyphenyl methylase/3-demethylubiquinone-9 3-methyltransferase